MTTLQKEDNKNMKLISCVKSWYKKLRVRILGGSFKEVIEKIDYQKSLIIQSFDELKISANAVNKMTYDLENIRLVCEEIRQEFIIIANDIKSQAIKTKANDNNNYMLSEIMRLQDLYYRDVMLVLDIFATFAPSKDTILETQNPIAYNANDHNFPRGTKNDNTRSPRFVEACERILGRKITHMDLGCAGGGLVLDFVLRGHASYGIEGSDFSLRSQRAEWRILRNCLYTSDITKEFTLKQKDDGQVVKCDVITAWEVMEHIKEGDLEQLFDNVKKHLKGDGLFIGSIATFLDADEEKEIIYHHTVQNQSWWRQKFLDNGMIILNEHDFNVEDFCRGTGNGHMDWNSQTNPEFGFHFVAKQNCDVHLSIEKSVYKGVNNILARFECLKEKNVPVFITKDLKPCAWYEMGSSPYKVIICSIPKAGTYLFAKLLENIGLNFCRLHLWASGFSDYRFVSIREGRENYFKYSVEMPLNDSLKLISPGQFAVSHLECTLQTRHMLKEFKKIYIYRNIRDVIVSHMRFMSDTGRGGDNEFMNLVNGPAKMIKYMETPILRNIIVTIRDSLAWMNDDDTLKVSFEKIYGDRGKDEQYKNMEEICFFLGVDNCNGYEQIINQTIGSETLTFSGSRTKWEDFWSDEVEVLFQHLGGVDINRELGYENN